MAKKTKSQKGKGKKDTVGGPPPLLVVPLGIDAGTTNTVFAMFGPDGKPIVVKNQDGEALTPTVAFLKDIANPVVGRAAMNQAEFEPQYYVSKHKRQTGKTDCAFVHPEKGDEVSPEQLWAMFLDYARKSVEAATGQKVESLVVTVPAYYTDKARSSMTKAVDLAGLRCLGLINEPTAAALAFLEAKHEDGTFLVYDLGGGTFDVTLLKIEGENVTVLATDGNRDLGGEDINDLLMNKVLEAVAAETGEQLTEDSDLSAYREVRDKVERAKKDLSSAQETKMMVSAFGDRVCVEITRDQLVELIRPILKETKEITERVVADAGLSWSEITDTILVGGSTRIPAVREMLERLSGEPPRTDASPDEAVALGAAIYAAKLASDQGSTIVDSEGQKALPPAVNLVDINAHPLGVLALAGAGSELRNVVIIKKNTPLPASASETFSLEADNQTSVKIQVVQGADGAAPDDVHPLGEIVLGPLPPGPAGPDRVDIRMELDKDAILHVTGKDLHSGQDVSAKIERVATSQTQS